MVACARLGSAEVRGVDQDDPVFFYLNRVRRRKHAPSIVSLVRLAHHLTMPKNHQVVLLRSTAPKTNEKKTTSGKHNLKNLMSASTENYASLACAK